MHDWEEEGHYFVAVPTYDADFPPLAPSRQSSISIPTRASLDDSNSRRSTPPVPPGFEAQVLESRRSTPVVPPGLGKPIALPDLDSGPGSRPSSRPSSRASIRRTASHITPALPLRPATPIRVASRAATPVPSGIKNDAALATSDALHETPTKPSKGKEKIKQSDQKETGRGSDQGARMSNVKEKSLSSGGLLESQTPMERFPALHKDNTSKAADTNESKPEKFQTAEQTGHTKTSTSRVLTSQPNSAPVTLNKESTKIESAKRRHPGKLDITAARQVQEKSTRATSTANVDISGTPGKGPTKVAQQSSSAVERSESPSVASPAAKTAPRTLRVIQTPKAETPPPVAFPSQTPLHAPAVAAVKTPSRQPSVASINPPGTPSSEQVSMSDNISMTSTSQSRANSPPPGSGRIGSAPVRSKTKSQIKKERQERAKTLQEEKQVEVEPVPLTASETPQEAIVSRKKKTKKEREPKLVKSKSAASKTIDTSTMASRPMSPLDNQPAAETPKSVPASKVSSPTAPNTQQSPQHLHEPSPPPTPTMTPASLLAELKASAPEIQRCIDSLFRTPNAGHTKANPSIPTTDLNDLAQFKSDFKVNLARDEVDGLLTGKLPSLHYGGDDGRLWDRGMVTPSGAHLRALTEELEQRFLDLEIAIESLPEELRFHSTKPQNETKFPAIDLEALKKQFESISARGVNVMEQMVQDGSGMRKGAFLVDEASKYINEFVMPPATPPPSAGGHGCTMRRTSQGASGLGVVGRAGGGMSGAANAGLGSEHVVPTLEIAERQLQEARRVADEREQQLRRQIKKNRKVLGLG